MNYRIYLQDQKAALPDSNLLFQGYINHHGKLLYDNQAIEALEALLQTTPLQDVFKDINGSFWLIYQHEQSIHFSVDHVGAYSLFYTQLDGTLYIFDNPMQFPFPKQLNDAALCSLFAAGYTQNDDTFFKDIHECEPGILYCYDQITRQLSKSTWYSYFTSDSKAFNVSELEEILDSLFPKVTDFKYTVSLSGGIDSRFLIGNLLKKAASFHAYSFGSERNKDKQIAAELCAKCSIPFLNHAYTPEICQNYFTPEDIEYILKNCTLGRSLPNETDLISANILNPQTDIIVKGFCGDGLAGSMVNPETLKLKSLRALADYIFQRYYGMTCISGSSYRNLLKSKLEWNLKELYVLNKHEYLPTYEVWHLKHRQRKYQVNTLAFYKAKGYRFYLPFYDRKLMDFFAPLYFSARQEQNAYFTYLREHFFTGKLAPLKDTISSRSNFLRHHNITLSQNLKKSIHNFIRDIDEKKLRKRFSSPSPTEYADIMMLYNHDFETIPYLKNKISVNYPDILKVSDFLLESGCPQAAKHLKWLAGQETYQMSINGISLCKFFFTQEFINIMKVQISD